jgi:ABC-2 type transport system ATP-binding protein
LDEPLANLDVLAQQLILEDLKSLSKSISNPLGIILSSQQLFEVEKIADKVLFLRNGVPTFLNELEGIEHSEKTVIEFDSEATREAINKAFAALKVIELHFNGGIYIVTFEGGNLTHKVMQAFIDHQIEVKYLRDISKSTRRLFLK